AAARRSLRSTEKDPGGLGPARSALRRGPAGPDPLTHAARRRLPARTPRCADPRTRTPVRGPPYADPRAADLRALTRGADTLHRPLTPPLTGGKPSERGGRTPRPGE